jgi:predicted nuclease of predicted toxin-antitoxin system
MPIACMAAPCIRGLRVTVADVLSRSAVLVTKDRDFALRRAATNDGPTILWVRVGNISNRKLIGLALRSLPAIIDAIERDEAVIEFVGR